MRGLPAAIIMGGQSGTALSVARSLGRRGVDVRFLGRSGSPESYSRYVRLVPVDERPHYQEAWVEFLLGPASDHLRGSVLLSCSDAGIELILEHRADLSAKYVLDISDSEAQRCLLDKLSTYRKAAEAGVPTPRFWSAESVDQVRGQSEEYVYPLLIKPLYSHKFSAVFDRKFFVVDNLAELLRAYEKVRRHDLAVVLLELIPGPDDRLCSYYTYIDETGTPLFDFTKRIIRRYPENHGLACYHITDWVPEARDLGRRLFASVGLRGLGNVEFKLDERDGVLKVIECNARFTAGNGLVAASGYDLGWLVYSRLTGLSQPALGDEGYVQGLRLWSPGRDFLAFLELRRSRGLSLGSWVASVMHRQVFPYFRWYDPLPSVGGALMMPRRLRGLERRLTGKGGAGGS